MLDNATPKQWAEWLRAPLEHAAGQGDLELVTKLLNAGANGKSGVRGCRGRTLLDAAAEGGNEKVVGALLAAGSGKDVNVRSGSKRRSPLHRAALMGHEAVATALLLAGADVTLIDSEKRRPLHLAVRGGHHQVACNLLLAGSTPNAKDKRGDAALHVAASMGHAKVVDALLLRGADKNLLDNLGRASLHLAAEHGHHLVVDALLTAGADPRIRYGTSELSVLDSAASHGRIDVLHVLYDHGVDVNATDSTGYTSLHMAADNDQVSAINSLVGAGANVEALDHHHWTPLHCASRYSVCCRAIRALLNHGANIHARETAGESPLHVACSYLAASVVDLLLRNGADETAVNDDGRTPAEIIGIYAEETDEGDGDAERVRRLVQNAPLDRAWRRRAPLVIIRSSGKAGPRGAGAIRAEDGAGCLKSGKTERGLGPRSKYLGPEPGRDAARGGERSPPGVDFAALLATVVELQEEGVFRTIIGFL